MDFLRIIKVGMAIFGSYTVPVDQDAWGEENVIAVRVYDGGGGGGIVGDPVSLSVKGLEELLLITPPDGCDRTNWC